MNLARALRVDMDVRGAFVGAGGKTTAMFQLARALPGPVLVTNSTHLGEWQTSLADRHWVITRPEDVERFAGKVEGITLFTGPAGADRRMLGLDAVSLRVVNEIAGELGFAVLLEADGSRQRPIKAPGEEEPVIPDWANLVVVSAGLSAIYQPLTEAVVHRPALFAAISDIVPGETIDEAGLAKALASPKGGLKAVPASSRRLLLLNQADSEEFVNAGLRIANELKNVYESVLITSLRQQQIHAVVAPVAGIILAGGASRRFGQPKMLLPWRGKPLIRHVVETALAAGLWPVVVVMGSENERLRQALQDLPVELAENPEWQQGQSTSVRRGVDTVGEKAAAAIFLLADQPFVNEQILRALVQAHQRSLAPVIAPRVKGQRTNPVLFDRDTFGSMRAMTGDTGGRAIFEQFGVSYVDWPEEKLLLDIDTPEDYQHLQEIE